MMSGWWADDEQMTSGWWADDEQMMSRWWADDERMMSRWWANDKQMMSRWWADDERMMSWWWADDERMMSGWWTDFFFSFDILLAKASRWQQAAAELHKYFLDDESIHRRGLDLKNVYLSTKKFTPDLQIFYTFLVFGLNVHVLGVKVPPNAMKRIIFIKLYPTSKRRMLLSENLPQTSRFFTRIYPQYPWHFTTLSTLCHKFLINRMWMRIVQMSSMWIFVSYWLPVEFW